MNPLRAKRSFVVALLLAAAFAGGCIKTKPSGPAAVVPTRVTVLVAASAKEAVEEIALEFEAEEGVEVDVSVGASNALAQQILAGAPADLFLSASEEWADALADENLIGQRVDLLSNRLVLVVPRGNPAGVKEPADLVQAKVEQLALAEENVPAGRYAEQALTKLELFEKLSMANKIARGHDVRATLAFVERGEAEAGIVYATDALVADQVEVVYRFEAATHDPIVYPLVLLNAGESNAAAVRLFDRLQTPESQEVFRRRGFEPVPTPSAAR
jgi:molybdate transport system substrate-binding protein